jgi:hypothetical protein
VHRQQPRDREERPTGGSRVLDGDNDTWIDALAWRIADYVGLVDPSTGKPNPSANLKGESYSDYDGVIVRPWFEMNGTTLNSTLPWVDDPIGTRARGIQEFNAAWCYLVDRVRNTNGATNASFFWCFAFTGDAFRGDPTNYLPSENGGTATNDGNLRNRIQFLGLDTYDRDGSGIDGTQFGDTNRPMLVGEWGTCMKHQLNTSGTAPIDRKWNCTPETTTFANEKCRGRWIQDSAADIVHHRAGLDETTTNGRA